MVELDVPAMVHVSSSCNPNFHATGAHYINADTTAFMQFLTADLFKDFPTLRFIIPHGGGAVPYHWGRYRGLAQDMKRPPLDELMRNNVFFDTCVYHQPGIELLLKIVPVENILFGSEMVGAVRGIDPETGHYFDDTKRYIDQMAWLSDEDRQKDFRRERPARLSAHQRRDQAAVRTGGGCAASSGSRAGSLLNQTPSRAHEHMSCRETNDRPSNQARGSGCGSHAGRARRGNRS